jgi:HIRAN domain
MSQYKRPVTCFHAKVAGVTHGTRQAAIAKLRSLETLDLVPEPDNPADPNAIKVCRLTGEQIGYLKRARARQLVEKLDDGYRCAAFVKRVSGGETHYVSITVLVMSPEATDEQIADYVNRYDVLGGITLSLTAEGTLVASPAIDLVADVSVRRRPKPLTIRFVDPENTPIPHRPETPTARHAFPRWILVTAVVIAVIIVFALRSGGSP